MGATWIHGLGGRDQDLRVPLEHIEGHLLIVGTTGAGKTRAFDLLVTQAVLRDEAVVIIDPKGDQDLRRTAERACALAGRPQRFVYFHPAFPAESVRIDPLHSFSRATELASRVAALIPSETGSDADKARQVLGNINNVVALRVLDAETQKYIAESLPMARVVSIMAAHGSTTDSTNPLLYTGNTGERLMEEEVELFPRRSWANCRTSSMSRCGRGDGSRKDGSRFWVRHEPRSVPCRTLRWWLTCRQRRRPSRTPRRFPSERREGGQTTPQCGPHAPRPARRPDADRDRLAG